MAPGKNSPILVINDTFLAKIRSVIKEIPTFDIRTDLEYNDIQVILVIDALIRIMKEYEIYPDIELDKGLYRHEQQQKTEKPKKFDGSVGYTRTSSRVRGHIKPSNRRKDKG